MNLIWLQGWAKLKFYVHRFLNWHPFGTNNWILNAKTNRMYTQDQNDPGAPGPDPKKNKQKDGEAETEGTEIVNGLSQTQVTNSSEVPAEEPNDSTTSEEENEEKLNNLRDALNSDNLPLPPDEGNNRIVN